MKLDFIICLGILLAIVFVGIVGAFLLYVPALTVLTVATLLIGILTGRRSRKLSPFSHRAMPIIR
jgi:Flp pilus assembly protein TadB